MRYGAPAFLLGWLITFVLICLGLAGVTEVTATTPGSISGWTSFPIYLVFGFPVAAILGLPFAIVIAWPLRRVQSQWLHVGVHGLATGAAVWTVMTALGGWTAPVPGLLFGSLFTFSAAAGRASVIKLVARRNAR